MRPSLPFLFPRPRAVVQRGGALVLPTTPAVLRVESGTWDVFQEAAAVVLKNAGDWVRIEKCFSDDGAIGEIHIGAVDLPSEGFALEISDKDIRIDAADARGAFYAVQTLGQLLRGCGGRVLCANITDYPDLPVRGFMLDISRCKVPEMATLRALIAQLAMLRINQFQLYTEHTFAFPGHEVVWENASPLTAPEVRELDALCLAHGMELVPNLQSFGHMDRWLKHAPYRHLAECPDGFFYELTNAHRDAGTLKPDQASLDFVAKLYDAYLPHFSSRQLNIGADEPWELGKGWSKSLCETRGRHAVYREHLRGIHQLVTDRAHTMQFWADILLEDPAHAAEAPAGAVPVIWGYDAGHPFAEQCATLEKLGCEYLVAPGVSSWQTFHGRLDNALPNVNEAVRAALAHGARGLLVTSWGDNGNHHPWFVFYPALAAGAAQAWCLTANANVDLAAGMGAIFLDGDSALAAVILEMGRLDDCFAKRIRNKSLLWEILFAPQEKLADVMNGVTETELSTALAAIKKWDGLASVPSNETVLHEIAVAQRLQRLAIARARLFFNGTNTAERKIFQREAIETIEEYCRVWRLRAREGGLAESIAWIEKTASTT